MKVEIAVRTNKKVGNQKCFSEKTFNMFLSTTKDAQKDYLH